MHITTLGIDLAKRVFQLHGVDARIPGASSLPETGCGAGDLVR
jgi:hypothetical protein